MRIAIAQPTYLPWLGYFDLVDQVDQFVLLDTVQFEKRSWQQRNRIKGPAGLIWLTVPVAVTGRFDQLITDVEISDAAFSHKHLRALEMNYRRAPYFKEYFSQVAPIIERYAANARLVDANTELIAWLNGVLGIQTRMVRASSLGQRGKRTELLANICQSLGANEYLSALGSADYLLAEIETMKSRGISVLFHHYQHPEYLQLFPPFIPYASVLDVIFNEGPAALGIIRGGRRKPFVAEEAAIVVGAGRRV